MGYVVTVWFMCLIAHKGLTFFAVYRAVQGLPLWAGRFLGLIDSLAI